MSTDANKDEQTQPIRVETQKSPSEDTSRIILTQLKLEPAKEIPAWLLEFASQPSEEASGESQQGLEAIEEPAPEPLEAIAPIVLETAEWHVVQSELLIPVSEMNEDASTISTEQDVQDFLALGNYAAAADLISKSATTKELAQESQRTLRSYLVLQEDRLPLWNVYDELSKRITKENTQTESTEDEWKDR